MKLPAASLGLVLFLASHAALAADAPQDEDPVRLAASIDEQAKALSTDDCETACRALGSMQRATERLCKMDPGASCAKARQTVDAATRRVHDACPACANAVQTTPPPPPVAPSPDEATKAGGESRTEVTQSAPPSESARGGCASCDTSGGAPSPDAALFAFAWLVTRLRARRRRRGSR